MKNIQNRKIYITSTSLAIFFVFKFNMWEKNSKNVGKSIKIPPLLRSKSNDFEILSYRMKLIAHQRARRAPAPLPPSSLPLQHPETIPVNLFLVKNVKIIMTSYAWTHTSVVIHRCRGHQVWSKCLFKTRQKAASIIPIPTHPQHHSLPYIPKHFHATCSCVSACDSFEGPTAHCWLSCCDKSCGIKHCRASSKVTYTLPLILRLAYTCYRCIYFTHMQLLISHKSGCPFQDKASPKRVILGQRRAPRPSDIAIHNMHAHYAHLSYREVDMITLKTPQKISSCSSASQALSKQVAWAIAVKSCTQVADYLGTFIGKLWHTLQCMLHAHSQNSTIYLSPTLISCILHVKK